MTCTKVQIGDFSAIVDMAGPILRICSGGKEFFFEFHEYMGPMMVGKRGQPIQSLPTKCSPFWDALYWWIRQGKRIDANRNCVFDHEMKLVDIVKQIGPRTWKILGVRPKGYIL
jgi:hypothetical protein